MTYTFTPQNADKLSDQQKRDALKSLAFLKENRDGSIKGQTCADGRKQRAGSAKSDTTSPTVLVESVLITSMIDAFDGRDFAIVDVPGAFLMVNMDEEVYTSIMGHLAEIMVKTAPDIYRKCVSTGPDNKPIMYVKLQKALYGCLRSALLVYLKLVTYLESD
jgi:hypothetical protein